MSVSRVRENRTHGSMRRREATPDQSATAARPRNASRRPYNWSARAYRRRDIASTPTAVNQHPLGSRLRFRVISALLLTARSDNARQVGGDCWFPKKRQRVPARLRTSAARPLRQ